MKNLKKYLSFAGFLLILTSCGKGNAPEESSEKTKIINFIKEAVNLKNYTIDVDRPYDSDFQSFTSNTFLLQNKAYEYYEGYVEDETGIYYIKSSSDGTITEDYYLQDENNAYVHDLYNFIYSLSDLTLKDNLYTLKADSLYIDDLESDDAQVMFALCGYDTASTTEGETFADVEQMYFTLDNDELVFTMVFNETDPDTGYVTLIVNSVNSTENPSNLNSFLENGGEGKVRISENDELYDELAYVKNLTNFTLNIHSDYARTEENYKVTSKYTANAYFSVSDREGEDDLGAVETSSGVMSLYYNEITDTYIIGDAVTDSDGNTVKYLEDYIQTFSSLSWDESTFKACIKDEKYIIDDTTFNRALFNMFDEYLFAFQLLNMTFYKDTDYHFIANLYGGDKIYLDIVNIGKTEINIPS